MPCLAALDKPNCFHIPQRWVMCGLCCSAAAIKHFTDTMVGETIAKMKESITLRDDIFEKAEEGSCPFFYEINLDQESGCDHSDITDLQYLSELHGIGYLICQIPVSVLTYKFGSCKLFGVGMAVSSILNALFPFLASKGNKWMGVMLFLLGAAKSVVFPCILNLMAKWSPINKRSTYIGILITGVYSGRVTCHILFQLVLRKLTECNSGFYVSGVVTLVWSVVWFALAYDSPLDNPCVTEKEQALLKKSRVKYPYPVGDLRLLMSIPWKRILTNLPFLSLLMMYFACDWLYSGILVKVIFSYSSHILHFPLKLATLSPVITIAAAPSALLGGLFSDCLINKKIVSNTVSKRIFIFVGAVFPPTLMLFLPLTGCNWYPFLALFVATLFFKGLVESPIHVSTVELSPQHAGLLMAIMNLVGTVSSSFSSLAVGAFVSKPDDKSGWVFFFLVSSLIALILSIPYMFWGSGKDQLWNRNPQRITISSSNIS